MWTYNYNHQTELYHHGIKGQKWGVQNGPPYPLADKKVRKIYENYTNRKGQLSRRGVRKLSKYETKLYKKDAAWLSKRHDKIYDKAYKKVQKKYMGTEENDKNLTKYNRALLKNDKRKASKYAYAYNSELSKYMNKKIKDLTAPSGRPVAFVSKMEGIGVDLVIEGRLFQPA